jgi:hypothetical protein
VVEKQARKQQFGKFLVVERKKLAYWLANQIGLRPTATIPLETTEEFPVRSYILLYCDSTGTLMVLQVPLLQDCDVSQIALAWYPDGPVKVQVH